MIYSAHDNIRLRQTALVQKCTQCEFNTVRRGAAYSKTEEFSILMKICNAQRQTDREGVPDRRLLTKRSHHDHAANLAQREDNLIYAARVNAVVVGNENVHCPCNAVIAI